MSKIRKSKHYNIAKRARDWANQTTILIEVPNWALLSTRASAASAMERMMREAYQEGIEEGRKQIREEVFPNSMSVNDGNS